MGGKKKKSLTAMEKAQRRAEEKRRRREARLRESQAKGLAGVLMPDIKDQKVLDEIKKMNVLTPYSVASRFNIRISVAKDMLEKLHQRGVVTFISGSRNLKIYKPS
ncbi:hypothetical protein CW702_00735 [Candidatus Bathyarchaeota archaeon]|nr:MAG: hypothetical protein CW702_00735 [Candidatus Bathyarchaeota archaeon]